MDRILTVAGALAGLGAVALSAVAAHRAMEPAASLMLRDAVQMQGWHALALLFAGQARARLAGIAFLIGVIGFCAPIYALVFFAVKFTFIAPYGGGALMLGWALIGVAAFRRR
jgi:hypothetical protein